MKALLIIGILLIMAGATLANNIGISGTWIFQVGLIFLFGAMAIFVSGRRATTKNFAIWKIIWIVSFGLMLLLTIWGFLNGMWNGHPLGFIIALAGCIWVFYRGMKSQKDIIYKFSRRYLIIGIVVLVIILFFVFSNKSLTQQAPNLQEQSIKELTTSGAITGSAKTPGILSSEDKLRAQIRKAFPGLSPQIIEIKIEDGTLGKTVIVKYSRNKGSNYLFDDAGDIYKAIFTYGEKVQRAVIEQYFTSFQDKYGNRCELLAWASKIDNQITIAKVNWEKISEDLVQPWWKEIYMYELDAVCK